MKAGERADLSSAKLIRAGGRAPGQLRIGARYNPKPNTNMTMMKRMKMMK